MLSGKKEWILYILIVFGGISSLLEYRYFEKQELFLGSVCMATGLFLLAIIKKDAKIPEFLAWIGQKNSFFIYLFHLCMADILKDVFKVAGLVNNFIYLWARPFMVCILVTAVAIVYHFASVILYKNMLK